VALPRGESGWPVSPENPNPSWLWAGFGSDLGDLVSHLFGRDHLGAIILGAIILGWRSVRQRRSSWTALLMERSRRASWRLKAVQEPIRAGIALGNEGEAAGVVKVAIPFVVLDREFLCSYL